MTHPAKFTLLPARRYEGKWFLRCFHAAADETTISVEIGVYPNTDYDIEFDCVSLEVNGKVAIRLALQYFLLRDGDITRALAQVNDFAEDEEFLCPLEIRITQILRRLDPSLRHACVTSMRRIKRLRPGLLTREPRRSRAQAWLVTKRS